MKQEIMEEARRLRKQLHETPELAFSEHRTKAILIKYLTTRTNLPVADCGKWFYAIKKGTDSRESIAFRADYDAVMGKDGVPGHFCGHDGHAAILAAFGRYLSEIRTEKTIYLLFQPAEETGQGALLCRDIIKEKNIQEIYGFHNIPGFEQNSVLLLPGTFACASTGMEITITGTPSHAAYPEAGKNPAGVIASLIQFKDILLQKDCYNGMVLGTVIGVAVGSEAYGVSAGKGTLRLTVRAEKEEDFQSIISAFQTQAEELSRRNGMKCMIRFIEPFPSTENDRDCIEKVRRAALENHKKIIIPPEPFRWSEDFGYYLQETRGAFFGIGAGENHPQLHTEDYSFPDEIMETVLDLYCALIV